MPPPKKSAQKLDIKAEFAKLKTMYQEDIQSQTVNILLLGESGSGKTFLMRTAPGITHIDSFDPGGSKGLREFIDKGTVMVDARWESENPWEPKQFVAWEKEMERRIKIGYFDHIDNYMLDSSTTWSQAIMHQILKLAGIPGKAPRFTHDYGPQKVAIGNWIKRIIGLPCNVIITGHLETKQDATTGKVTKRFMTTGQGSVVIPLLFDEIWVMSPKSTSKGTTYRVLTQSTGNDLARSRMAADGLLDQYENADLSAMMRKAKLLT